MRDGKAYEYRLDGYWKDVGTISAYWGSHMDLLDPEPRPDLDDMEWPILTQAVQRPPAHVYETARIQNSLVSPGCIVRGEVTSSVLSSGVVVEEGAVVRSSVLLENSVVCRGATLEHAIVDESARIGEGATVGAAPGGNSSRDSQPPSDSDIALVGPRAAVPAGLRIPAGARIQPGNTTGEYEEPQG